MKHSYYSSGNRDLEMVTKVLVLSKFRLSLIFILILILRAEIKSLVINNSV